MAFRFLLWKWAILLVKCVSFSSPAYISRFGMLRFLWVLSFLALTIVRVSERLDRVFFYWNVPWSLLWDKFLSIRSVAKFTCYQALLHLSPLKSVIFIISFFFMKESVLLTFWDDRVILRWHFLAHILWEIPDLGQQRHRITWYSLSLVTLALVAKIVVLICLASELIIKILHSLILLLK